MSLPTFATQTVIVWRAPLVVDHGTSVRDWDNAASHDVTGCSVQPGVGSEDRVNRDSTTTLWTVLAPSGADVLDTDQVEWRGVRYEVDGSVQHWETGVLDHLRIALRGVAG